MTKMFGIGLQESGLESFRKSVHSCNLISMLSPARYSENSFRANIAIVSALRPAPRYEVGAEVHNTDI